MINKKDRKEIKHYDDFHVQQIQKSEYISIDDNHLDPMRCKPVNER